jgi:hypothetical protein
MCAMLFDAVLSVGPQHREIAIQAIRSVRYCTTARTIFVVTARENFAMLEHALGPLGPEVQWVDENQLIPQMPLARVQALIAARGLPAARAGWYFQQFLKLGMSVLADLAEHYLVWDCDTVALRPLAFFTAEGRVLVNPQHLPLHTPYYTLLTQLWGVSQQRDFSFIAEHLVMRKTYVQEMLKELRAKSPPAAAWPEIILAAIGDEGLGHSGFSEFETYGNWVLASYPEHFEIRPLKSMRFGGRRFGAIPSRADLFALMVTGHAYATFEIWDKHPHKLSQFLRKCGIKLWVTLHQILGRRDQRRTLARKIAG